MALLYVLSLWVASASGAEANTTPHRNGADVTWVRHVVARRESAAEIADRFGTDVDELRDGKRRPIAPRELQPGRVLWVPARELPPPRQRRRIWVAERTPWNEIAEAHAETGLDAADFKRQNPRYSRRRTVPARKFISIWAQSGVERRPETALDPNAPPVEANGDAVSIGRPQVGRIKHAEPLPPSSDYEIVFPDAIYGTSLTIATIQAAVTRFRDATGFEGSVRVGAISRRRGGKFPPHRSHQSGRDVDMPLLPMPYVTGNRPLRYDEVDWHATWALLAAFVETGRVQAVFVDERHHRRLRRAGLRMGATDAEIEAVMGMVMHAHGHGSHLHIRVQCSENAPRCKG